jgi:SAM-dependent methyltransferase
MRIWIHLLLERLRLATAAFRLRETWRSLKGPRRLVVAPDGFPVPPAKLMVLVTGSADTRWYTEGGRLGVESICGILDQGGARPADLQSVLDFGCGCGRVIRYWRSLTPAQLYGTDCNPRLVDWCRRNLPFAKFQSNTLEPRLNYADHQFEFAYALSVLTHTPEDQQQPWMNELWRILRPRGYLLITTQGDEFLPKLTQAEHQRYGRGQIVVRHRSAAGSNLCSVYHPETYVREKLAFNFEIVASSPRGAAGNGNQDMYLLRKPG